MNIQGWFPLGLTGFTSVLSKELSRVFSNTTVPKHPFFGAQPSLWSNSHGCTWLLEKPLLWLYGPLSEKWYLCFLIMLSRCVIAFLPRSKCPLISWLQSPSSVILEPKKIKSVTVSIFTPSICHEVMKPDAMILVFWMLSFKPGFSISSFTIIKNFLPLWWCHRHIWGYRYFSQQSCFKLVLHPTWHFAHYIPHII